MLINCAAYQEGARLVDLPVEEPSPEELDPMRFEFNLHPLANCRDVSDHLDRIWESPAALGLIAGTCSFVWWRFRLARWL